LIPNHVPAQPKPLEVYLDQGIIQYLDMEIRLITGMDKKLFIDGSEILPVQTGHLMMQQNRLVYLHYFIIYSPTQHHSPQILQQYRVLITVARY